MAKNRPRKFRASNAGQYVNLYPADTSKGWVLIRTVLMSEGERKVRAGEWRPVVDGFGNLHAFQVIRSFRTDEDLASTNEAGRSQASIRPREIEMVAGLRGESRTWGRSEDWRVSRPRMANGHVPPPEDDIEKAIAKWKVFPKITAAPGDIVRAWAAAGL